MFVRYAALAALLCAIASFFSPSGRVLAQTAPNWTCIQDLNGDGSIDDPDEQASCITAATGTGELCPISAVNCVIQTSSATCPAIAPLNPATGKCEMPPQCSSGSYDSTNHDCVDSSPPSCSSPTATFDSTTNLCESPSSCPSGSTYDSKRQICVTTSSPVCVTGMTFNTVDGRCESVPSCPNGGSYSNATEMCEIYDIKDPTCPANTTFNLSTNMCEAPYYCSQGTLDQTTKKCISTYSASCPSGTAFESMNGQCESAALCASGTYDSIQKACVTTTYVAPTCPIGSSLNPSTDMCEASPTCPSGATYDSASQSCFASPVCPVGTYDSTSKMCVSQSTSTPICASGLTYLGSPSTICSGSYSCPVNTSDNGSICSAAPTCASGTYDSTQHACVIQTTTYSTPSCPIGTSLNTSVHECAALPSCVSGASYNTTNNDCEATNTPTCAHSSQGSTFTASFDRCQTPLMYWPVVSLSQSCKTCIPNMYIIQCTFVMMSDEWIKCGEAPSCSLGTYSSTTKNCQYVGAATCPTSTTLNGSVDLCTSTPTCMSGTFDASTNECKTITSTTAAAICPAGTSLNTTADLCEANYICPPGSSYNSANKDCEASPTCSSGNFTSSTGMCVLNTSTAPTCLSGETFNPTLQECVSTLSCPTGLSWDSTKNACDGPAPTCTTGSYDPSTHMCAVTTASAPSCNTGTYNSGDGKCETPLVCPNGSTYDTIFQTCALKLSPTCPAGTSFDSTAVICNTLPGCPSTYVYDSTQGKCIYSIAYNPTCQDGTTIDVITNMCYSTPTCNSGFTYDNVNFICSQLQPVSCSSPTDIFNPTTNLCQSSPVCSSGTYDLTQQVCSSITLATCPTGGYLNTTLNVCQANPGCLTGTLDSNSGMCASTGGATAPATCSSGLLNTSTNTCQTLPTCPSGSTYNSVSGLCVDSLGSTSPPSCPIGTTLNLSTGMCETAPTCPTNYTYDTTQDLCVSFAKSCPLNTATITYQCMDPGSGVLQCSPNPCIDLNTSTQTTTANTTSLTNDGTVDPNTGQCSGSIYIFNGKPMTCRPRGMQTNYCNCCSNAADGSFLKICSQEEVLTDSALSNKLCHYVGQFCSDRINLIFTTICIQDTNTYCCFNSMLGRIIQEQGRPQLQAFQSSGWGSPQSPNCIGFTPEQFQMLNFSKMDLSEYFASIQQTMSSQVQNNMVNNVNKYYQNSLH